MIIIPARIASSRFPEKILADIGGVPMVIKTAQRVCSVDKTVIATDSREVVDIAKSYGFDAVMTSSAHKSGTDRLNEAASALGLKDDEVIINVQADEPFIETQIVQSVKELTQKHKNNDRIMLNSAYKTIPLDEAIDTNLVKVVLNASSHAIYFSRSVVPFDRDKVANTYKAHLGIYGYTKKMLERFCALGEADIEEIEKLEQLRAIYHGYSIAMTQVHTQSFGIDTPQDLEKAKQIFL
jgi:3-deoxy-manno-octulosonate cytidylyltransferase (CMP-KDO synthetase)